jgi:hypothetical protein
VGLAAAGLALFVSTTGPVRLIAGVVGAPGLLVMLWPRHAQSEATNDPQKDGSDADPSHVQRVR